ncbi:MAG: alkaline phosphatase family protein [Candidatus Eremiobacteraeota bacterium]|nr:alkaline phosphatase family protein [Candidatus Eremiobacteraeota bacterium]
MINDINRIQNQKIEIEPRKTDKKTDDVKPVDIRDKFNSTEAIEKRKLVLLQIDGLSHKALKYAMKEGHAPNIKKLVESDKYALSPFRCGIATVTIPVLASLFYGVELPGNDWYDKESGQHVDGIMYETKLREDLAKKGEKGILSQGAVFSSPLSGGATNTAMVVNPLKESKNEVGVLRTLIKEAKKDIKLLKKGGYSLTKTAWNFVRDIFKARSWMKKEGVSRTKLDKLAPIMMSLNHNIIEKVACEGLKEAIEQGLPTMYCDFAAYDEKAHYFGAMSKESMEMLRTIDDKVGQVAGKAEESKDNYEVLVFSDHGQTPSELFEDVYKTKPGDMIKNFARNVATSYDREFKEDDIVFTDAYSLGNVYFNFSKQKVDLDAVENHHPGLADFLTHHPGIGLVVGAQDKNVIMKSKEGTLEVSPDGSKKVTGKNPLTSYGDENVLSDQIVDYMNLKTGGDVVIFGAYEKGKVMDFNDNFSLKSLHGGIGGEQTKPFIISQTDMPIKGEEITEAKQLHDLHKKYRKYLEGYDNQGKLE